jgi:hypothetical protein
MTVSVTETEDASGNAGIGVPEDVVVLDALFSQMV